MGSIYYRNTEVFEQIRATFRNYDLHRRVTFYDKPVKHLETGKVFTGAIRRTNFKEDLDHYHIYEDGLLHSFKYPAICTKQSYNNSVGTWFFKGKEVFKNFKDVTEYFEWCKESNIDIDNITPEDEELIKMRYL